MSNKRSNIGTRLDQKQAQDVQAKFTLYENQSQLNKIDIVTNFYETIQGQRKTIFQLESKNGQLNTLKAENDSNASLNNTIERLLQRRNKTNSFQVEKLKDEADRLRKEIKQLNQMKMKNKIQVLQPNLKEAKQKLSQDRIGLKAQLQVAKQKIQSLQQQNQLLQTSNRELSSKFGQLQREALQQIKNMQISNSFKDQLQAKDQIIEKLTKTVNDSKINIEKKDKQLKAKDERHKDSIKLLKQIFGCLKMDVGKQRQIGIKIANYTRVIQQNEELSQQKKQQGIKLVKQFVESVAQLNTLFNNLQSEKQNLALEIKKQRGFKQQVLSQLSRQKKSTEALQKQNIRIQTSLKDQTKIKQSLQAQNTKQAQLIANKSGQIKEHQKNIKQLSEKLKLVENQFGQLKKSSQAEIRGLKIDLSNANSKIGSQTRVIQSLEKDTAKLKSDLQRLHQQKNKFQLKKIGQIEDLLSKLAAANDKILALQSKIKQLQDIINQRMNQIKSLNKTIQGLQSDLNDQRRESDEFESQLKQTKQVLSKVNRRLIGTTSQAFIHQNRMLKFISSDKSKQLDKQMEQLFNLWKKELNGAKFFNDSQIISKDQVDWILNTLQSHKRQTPVQTKLIYRYDPLNPINFHQYIDKVPHLLVLVKISNGTIIGGFTVHSFDRDMIVRPGKGFIFNLNYFKAYYMRNQPRLPVNSYDDYYMILGNAEIRIRSQENKVFSNFGIANSTFDSGNDPRTKFLGVSNMLDNQLEVDCFEFYQVNFAL